MRVCARACVCARAMSTFRIDPLSKPIYYVLVGHVPYRSNLLCLQQSVSLTILLAYYHLCIISTRTAPSGL